MTVNISKPAVNVREKLAELDKPTGIAGEAMLRAETPQEQFNLIGAGRRNLLINGDFQVSQRGDFTSASSATNGEYFVDRWYADTNTTINKQQTTGIDLDGTPAITKGVKLTATASASAYVGIRQKIENPTQYVGRTFTYSGYVRSNNPNARLTTFIADTAGTTNQVVSSNAHSGNGQWEKLSVTFSMTSNATSAWFVSAFISSSAVGNVSISNGDYIEVTMLQMEIGKVATPFEHRSYGEELALCQRYTYVIDGPTAGDRVGQAFISAARTAIVNINFPVVMRAKPTLEGTASQVTINDNTAADNSTSIALNGANKQYATLSVTTGSDMNTYRGAQAYFTSTADNKIIFKAEL